MQQHTDWQTPGFDLEPVAEATGPFARRDFLQTLWDHRAVPGEELLLVEAKDAFVALRRRGGGVEFIGEADLTDYHSPLGSEVPALVADFASAARGSRFRLDSLPLEAAEVIAKGFHEAGVSVSRREHAVVAVLPLPASFEEYLASIGKKERHEVRRKRRRYEAVGGEVRIESHFGAGPAVDEFVRLHRLAAGAKGEFMTTGMAALFADLLAQPGWRLDLLVADAGVAAAMIGYADDEGYYLYNSAYDPALRDASPGMVLLAAAIERCIENSLSRFDFLKGDESYKFRLGAQPRPLFVIEAVT